MIRFPAAAALAAAALLVAGCSDDAKTAPAAQRQVSKSPAAEHSPGLGARPGKDLIVHQGSMVALLDRDTLQLRRQAAVPEPVAEGNLAGSEQKRHVFDSTFRYVQVGPDGMGADDAEGALKVVDLAHAGGAKRVITLGREALNAAGAKGTISAAQFAPAGRPELWFQTSQGPSGETWSSSTADSYKITGVWSVNVRDWQAGRRVLVQHLVPKQVQQYWQSQDCQTAFSQLQEEFTPWACWLVDRAGHAIPSGPESARVHGSVDTDWTSPASSSSATEKLPYSFLEGSDGRPATSVSIAGPGGGGASTLDGTSGLIDSGTASGSTRKMWRFTTSGTRLHLTELPHSLPPSTQGETQLWAFPDGRAVAKVTDGDKSTGWILTRTLQWKNAGAWPADIDDADVEPTA